MERYSILTDTILEGCMVTPEVYQGILARFEQFAAPFINHLHQRTHRQKAIAYMKGLMSDAERKNVESIAYYHGEDRQPLQKFIGQVEWDDNIILDKLGRVCTTLDLFCRSHYSSLWTGLKNT